MVYFLSANKKNSVMNICENCALVHCLLTASTLNQNSKFIWVFFDETYSYLRNIICHIKGRSSFSHVDKSNLHVLIATKRNWSTQSQMHPPWQKTVSNSNKAAFCLFVCFFAVNLWLYHFQCPQENRVLWVNDSISLSHMCTAVGVSSWLLKRTPKQNIKITI